MRRRTPIETLQTRNTSNTGLDPELIAQIANIRPINERQIVEYSNGGIRIGAFTITPVGLSSDGATFEEWSDFGQTIIQIKRAMQWIIGDYLAYGEDRQYGVTYAEWSALTGYTTDTLSDIVGVCRKVQLPSRDGNLSFSHHRVVADLPPDQQTQWLQYAAEHKLSVAALRTALGEVIESKRSKTPRWYKRGEEFPSS